MIAITFEIFKNAIVNAFSLNGLRKFVQCDICIQCNQEVLALHFQPQTDIPKTHILQRLHTGLEWKHIALNECQKLLSEGLEGFPRKGDFCIKASTPKILKSAGGGDSGGPLYSTLENTIQPSLGELVDDYMICKRTVTLLFVGPNNDRLHAPDRDKIFVLTAC